MESRRGFTLVELMIVVAILGILSAIAVPMYKGYITGAKKTEAKTNLETLRLLEEQYYADNARYTGAVAHSTLMNTATSPFRSAFKPGGNLYFEYAITGNNTTYTVTASDPTGAIGNFSIDSENNRNSAYGSW